MGTGAGGIYVKTADVVPFFSVRRRDLSRSEALETVAPKRAESLWNGAGCLSGKPQRGVL